ncbi:hypothetical protein GW17_00007483 [Ensete ventricosum]|nr:hypothetical protein GW17_00007483 [Ensete ventricosum]
MFFPMKTFSLVFGNQDRSEEPGTDEVVLDSVENTKHVELQDGRRRNLGKGGEKRGSKMFRFRRPPFV